jgi:hypothetical protein
MRRIVQASTVCLAAAVLSACSGRDAVTDTGFKPTGGVRFINAVPDTAGSGGMDMRFVDVVDNNNAQFQIPFRNNIVSSGGVPPSSVLIEYKAATAGSRHFRVFLDDTLPSVASTVLVDSTIDIVDQHRYTALLWGNSRDPATSATGMKLKLIDETCDPGDKIGLRVINTTGQAIDVRVYQNTATTTGSTTTNAGTAPATPTWTVEPMDISTCLPFDVTATPTKVGSTTTTVTWRFNVRAAGGTTSLFADQSALIGVANGTTSGGCNVGVDCDATPGTSAAGTALTAVIFPASVAGSKAAQFSTPAISFMWDKRPNRIPGT